MTIEDKRILVLGGAGFIGSAIAKSLVDENEVTILDNLSSGQKTNVPQGARLVWWDLREMGDQWFKDVDIVFHEAANVFIQKSIEDPILDAEINITGTLGVLEACRKFDVERLVFASSSSIYGDPISLPVSEAHPCNPKSPYAVGKLAGDQYCRIYHEIYGLKTTALRYFNVYGPGQRSDNPYSGVISIFMDRVRRGKPLTVYGDGLQTRDFVHVADVARANILAAKSKKAVGRAINIGIGERISLNQLIMVIRHQLGKEIKVQYKPERPGDIRHSVADISLANEILGYEPLVDLKEGLSTLLG